MTSREQSACGLHARLRADCARNLVMDYRLPVPVTVDLIASLDPVTTQVNEFSRFVADAQDHITALLEPGHVRLSAVVGECELVATFGSLESRSSPDTVVWFEEKLSRVL